MKTKLLVVGTALLVLAALARPLPAEDEPNGRLAFDVKRYASDVEMKEKVEKQLEHAGIEWGMSENLLVISMVNKKFVKVELPHMTRYGEQKVLELKPGAYRITCIGYVHSSNSRDVAKVLSASAFVNESVMTFNILPGKTTTLEILPTIEKQTKTSFLVKVKVFLPDLRVKVIEDGVPKGETIVNQRTSTSIAWDDYSGPLKF